MQSHASAYFYWHANGKSQLEPKHIFHDKPKAPKPSASAAVTKTEKDCHGLILRR